MKTKTIPILFFGLMIYFNSFAQHSPNEWLQLEAGVLSTSASDAGVYLEASYYKEDEAFKKEFGYRYASTFSLFKNPDESYNFLFARVPILNHQSRFFRVEWMVGPSFVWGNIRGDKLNYQPTSGKSSTAYKNRKFLSAGLETNIAVYGIAFKRVGIGVNLWTHLNFERQMAGFGLHLNGGKFLL